MQRPLVLLALLGALHAAHAVMYGAPGIGSQYQLFGRPIMDTTRSDSAVPIRSGVDTTAFAVIEGEAQKPALQAKACDKNFVYSEVFSKCLPAPGTDGYIGKATDETAKSKAAAESAFVPISVQTYAPMAHSTLPLRAQPLSSANAEQPPQQPQPTQMRGRAVAPVRQLRLACPAGFGFSPAVGACIAPAASMMGPEQQAMRMRMYRPRNDDDEEDGENNDDERDNELHRQRMHMLRRRFRHHPMFGHRFGFGGPRILAPVFVFVLPPLDRNATRFGMGFGGRMGGQRIHEIHPSMVGPIGGATTQHSPGTAQPVKPGEAPKEKPIEPQPTPGPKETTGTGPAPPKALRGAFVNPIVGSGKTLPLKAQRINREPMRVDTGVDDRAIRHDEAAPLKRSDGSSIAEPLLKRHAFVSPFVASHAEAA